MGILSKTETKLFITFFIIYSLFVNFIGWNEESRIDLAKSIVNEGRFEIDNYANLTGDRAFYEGHYYSDRAPGSSFLATPIYTISKQISGRIDSQPIDKVFVPDVQYNTTLYYLLDTPIEDSMMQVLSIIFLSALPGALLTALIYKMSNFFIKQLNLRLFISFLFGLASPIFPYSTVMMGVVTLTLFSFLAFYIVLKIIRKELNQKYLYISGVLLGFSVVIDYSGIFVFMGTILLLFLSNLSKKSIIRLLLAAVVGALSLTIYNFIIFSKPLQFTAFYIDSAVFGQPTQTGFEATLNRSVISPFLALFFPYRGLFFYTPILLLCFYGFYHLYKEDKNLTKALLFIFFSTLLTISPHWVGGSSFGQRHLIFTVPFLFIPFAACLQKIWSKTHFAVILIILIFISTLHNFFGLGSWECDICKFYLGPLGSKEDAEIAKVFGGPSPQIFSLEFALNPLYKHYLPIFIKNGPRSKILEGVLYDPYKIDIRHFKPIPVREIKLFTSNLSGILVLKVPFLVIPILLAIITLIWRKELFAFRIKTLSLGLFLLILIILLFLSRFEFKDVFYDKKWYPIHVNATHMIEERWIADKASIFFYWPKNEEVDLFFKIGTFYKPRNIRIEINNFSSDYLVTSYNDALITNANLKKGENIIHFESLIGCDTPALLINGSKDYRCLSFILHGFSVTGLPEYNIVFGKNWYHPEAHITWAYENPSVYIYSNQRSEAKLNLTLISYNRPRKIDFYINHILFDTIRIEPYSKDIITKTLPLREGNNLVEFINKDKCDIPALIEKSDDERCLSFGLINMNLVSPYELFEKSNLAFGPNWYEQEPDGRWMSNDASIFLFLEKEKEASLRFELASYHEKMEIEIYLNKNLILSKDIPTYKIEINTPKVGLFEGENLIEIKASKKCYIPAEIEQTKDERCLSFKLFSLRIV